jgi:D-glycero-D-manno-heptose 1,7-bisphosphate phosphatase
MGEAMTKAVFLDRDGTLVEHVRDVFGELVSATRPEQIRILPGVLAGLRMLHGAGYVLAVATNQPGAAKGQCSREDIADTNRSLLEMLAIKGIPIRAVASCLHHPFGAPGGDPDLVVPCRCRKPKTGLIDDLVGQLDVERAGSWMVGDSQADVECGKAAGLNTAQVVGGVLVAGFVPRPDIVGDTLFDLAEQIIKRAR